MLTVEGKDVKERKMRPHGADAIYPQRSVLLLLNKRTGITETPPLPPAMKKRPSKKKCTTTWHVPAAASPHMATSRIWSAALTLLRPMLLLYQSGAMGSEKDRFEISDLDWCASSE